MNDEIITAYESAKIALDGLKAIAVSSYSRNGKLISGYNKQSATASNQVRKPSVRGELPVPEQVMYPALYKRARIKARQKYAVWPSAYASAYLVSQYEKMVKARKGKPYRAIKSLELCAMGVLSYIQEGKSIDAIDYLKNVNEWFTEEWVSTDKGMLPKSVLVKIGD
jgi:hypothetical protein